MQARCPGSQPVPSPQLLKCVHAEVEPGVARKAFDLKLPQLGPYNVAFTRSGRHMLFGGRKGHLALMDWQRMHSVCEVQVRACMPGGVKRLPALLRHRLSVAHAVALSNSSQDPQLSAELHHD